MYEDCFARIEISCRALKEPLCTKGKCPFYKSKKQREEELEKYPHRDAVNAKGGGSDGQQANGG